MDGNGLSELLAHKETMTEQFTMEMHQLTCLTVDNQDQKLEQPNNVSQSRSNDDQNESSKEKSTPEKSCKGSDVWLGDVAHTSEANNKMQSAMVASEKTVIHSHACNTEVQTVENPFYIRFDHQKACNTEVQTVENPFYIRFDDQKTNCSASKTANPKDSDNTVPAHDTANVLVVNGVREPESDEYVEMRSFVKDAVIPYGKADVLKTTEVSQSQEPAATLGRDPNFTNSQEEPSYHNNDQESNNRVSSKLRHGTSWSTFNINSKDIPQDSDFICESKVFSQIKLQRNPANTGTVSNAVYSKGYTYAFLHTLPRTKAVHAERYTPSYSIKSHKKPSITQDNM